MSAVVGAEELFFLTATLEFHFFSLFLSLILFFIHFIHFLFSFSLVETRTKSKLHAEPHDVQSAARGVKRWAILRGATPAKLKKERLHFFFSIILECTVYFTFHVFFSFSLSSLCRRLPVRYAAQLTSGEFFCFSERKGKKSRRGNKCTALLLSVLISIPSRQPADFLLRDQSKYAAKEWWSNEYF